MIAIKHRFSGATICEFDVITTKECAVKGKENLSGAYLDGFGDGSWDGFGYG